MSQSKYLFNEFQYKHRWIIVWMSCLIFFFHWTNVLASLFLSSCQLHLENQVHRICLILIHLFPYIDMLFLTNVCMKSIKALNTRWNIAGNVVVVAWKKLCCNVALGVTGNQLGRYLIKLAPWCAGSLDNENLLKTTLPLLTSFAKSVHFPLWNLCHFLCFHLFLKQKCIFDNLFTNKCPTLPPQVSQVQKYVLIMVSLLFSYITLCYNVQQVPTPPTKYC